jgi:hypothetical protein
MQMRVAKYKESKQKRQSRAAPLLFAIRPEPTFDTQPPKSRCDVTPPKKSASPAQPVAGRADQSHGTGLAATGSPKATQARLSNPTDLSHLYAHCRFCLRICMRLFPFYSHFAVFSEPWRHWPPRRHFSCGSCAPHPFPFVDISRVSCRVISRSRSVRSG